MEESFKLEKRHTIPQFENFGSLAEYLISTGTVDRVETSESKEYEALDKNMLYDTRIAEIPIRELLERYHASLNDLTQCEQLGEHIFRARIEPQNIVSIDVGYGFKGGAARVALVRSLGMRIDDPRDYDVIRLEGEYNDPNYQKQDIDMAQKWMPSDFNTGHGVECVGDIARYMNTRDFTINEVMVYNEYVYFSEQCLQDTLQRVIRLSQYERKGSHDERDKQTNDNKLLAKAVRMYAESLLSDRYALEDLLEYRFNRDAIDPFFIAVHLDRAMERGFVHAKKFVELLHEKRHIPPEIHSPSLAVRYLTDI